MGCDLHLHTEVKIDGLWIHYSAPNVKRCYKLFALMAGVRNDRGIRPVAQPKGLPENISQVTRLDYELMGKDAHTPSWLSASELVELEKRLNGQFAENEDIEYHLVGYLFRNSWAGFQLYPNDRPPFLEDVRWVFWFDN